MGRSKLSKIGLGLVVSYAAIMVSGDPAIAQQAGATERSPQSTDQEASTDIIVMAQRRAQSINDVPVSITAVSGEDLSRANVTDTKELALVTPGLRLENTGFNTQPALRGIASYGSGPGSEPNVALYVDGVYQPFQGINIIQLSDVSRVEVLKGPQGTLFGRNATGGAIQIFTRDPSFVPTGKFEGSYGRFHDTTLSGFLSMPLVSDLVAVSLTGSHESSDGWNRHLVTKKRAGDFRSDFFRGKILAKPSEAIKLVFSGYYANRHDNAINAYSALGGNTQGRRFGATIIPDEPFEVANDFPLVVNSSSYGLSLKADIDVGIGTVSSITAYQHGELHLVNDGDVTPSPFVQITTDAVSKTKSQEFLFNSDWGGRLSLVSGIYLYKRYDAFFPPVTNITNGVLIAFQDNRARARSYAGFAEASYEVAKSFTLTAGLRYSKERRRTVNNISRGNPTSNSASFHAWTPKFAAIYEISSNTNIYAVYSRGFKSGVIDPASLKIVKPEKLDAYELGVKYRSGVVRLAVAGFYYDYANLQQAFLNPLIGVSSQENAGRAEIYGAELSGTVRLSPELNVQGGVSYVHAKYKEYMNASVNVPLTNAAGQPTLGGNRSISRDLSGQRLSRTPRFTGTITATYEKEFSRGALELSGTVYYSSWFGLETSNRVRQKGYEQINARASWKFGDSGFKAGIYGKNLTDSVVIYATSISGRGDLVSYQERRSYGVTASYAF